MVLTQELVLKHFDDLIAEGTVLPLERYSNNDFQLRGKYIAWKAHCLTFLKDVFMANDEYYNKIAASFNKSDPKLEKIYALDLLKSARDYYRNLQSLAIQPKSLYEKNGSNEKREIQNTYDYFISYYQGTGLVFAEYLKDHAKDFKHIAFLDRKEIRKEIKEETDEWRLQIDQGISRSSNFILIMTLGFNNRPEIKREWKKALEKGTKCFLFKKDTLKRKDLIMAIDNEEIDFSKYQYIPFSTNCDLLESVEARITNDPDLVENIYLSDSKKGIPSAWNPLPKVGFQISQQLLRTLQFPTVGWEAYNDSPYQLRVRIEVHPILGGKDLHPLSNNNINGKSVYPVEPNSPIFVNGCFNLPDICATTNEELILEIRGIVEDTNDLKKGKYALIPRRWKYNRKSNTWSYHPQMLMTE